MNDKLARALVLLAASMAPLLLRATDSRDLERALNQEYKGKVLVLRNFYSGRRLEYNADGILIKGGRPGPWTVYGNVEVERIKLGRDGIEINGRRVFLQFEPDKKRFKGLRAGSVNFRIKVDWDKANLSTLQRLVGRVFLSLGEDVADVAPPYWGAFLSDRQGAIGQPDQTQTYDKQKVEKVGGNITAPIPVHRPEPPYTEEARRAILQGTVVLRIVVDTEGNVKDIRLIQALGVGLDDQAVETVQTWKFKPATRDGMPVPVWVMVEIAFRLH